MKIEKKNYGHNGIDHQPVEADAGIKFYLEDAHNTTFTVLIKDGELVVQKDTESGKWGIISKIEAINVVSLK